MFRRAVVAGGFVPATKLCSRICARAKQPPAFGGWTADGRRCGPRERGAPWRLNCCLRRKAGRAAVGGCFGNGFVAGLACCSYKSNNFFTERTQPPLLHDEPPLTVDAGPCHERSGWRPRRHGDSCCSGCGERLRLPWGDGSGSAGVGAIGPCQGAVRREPRGGRAWLRRVGAAGGAGAPFVCSQDRLRQAQGERIWGAHLRRGVGDAMGEETPRAARHGACGPPFTLRFPSGRTASPGPAWHSRSGFLPAREWRVREAPFDRLRANGLGKRRYDGE